MYLSSHMIIIKTFIDICLLVLINKYIFKILEDYKNTQVLNSNSQVLKNAVFNETK